MTNDRQIDLGRRGLLGAAAGCAAIPLLTGAIPSAAARPTADTGNDPSARPSTRRRMLGSLEVSSVGLGVQNMHRAYPTTVP